LGNERMPQGGGFIKDQPAADKSNLNDPSGAIALPTPWRPIMGAWGAGLYSSDMAADMRAVIKSALRIPFDEDRIVDILRDCERRAADDSGSEDHTTFWLVLADQFEKRGVAHASTREKAIAIIDRGDDLTMMEKLGMKP